MQIASEVGGGPAGAIRLIFKAIGAGALFVVLAWIGVIATLTWRVRSYNVEHGVNGLGAIAGGWTFLLRSPMIVVLLAAAFGIGFYVAIRWSSH